MSEQLRKAAETEEGRRYVIAMLSTTAVWRIWKATAARSSARDRRTHEEMTRELRRRGLLGEVG